MYLRELRINGFKSFADPVKLDLRPGMTAIVGPNGCGKSNTADAIRWVLGEQSSKSLRAGSMQDVIFQGTTNRKPLSLCEVSLIFTDCEEQLGTAHKEVEVSRRVVRDGGSQYFINGKACRLRDIQNLFMDTGIGQVSYSFMLQGQIDKILSNNPTERRAIFEEAAGISKYKVQRKEALNKLSQVDANLARVTDVIEEVSRQIGSLKRQAGKAFRYKRIKHRLTHLDLAIRSQKFSALMDEVKEVNDNAEELRAVVIKAKQTVESLNSALEERKEQRNHLAEKLQVAQQNVYDLRSQKDQAFNQVELAQLRCEDSLDRVAALEKEIIDLKEEQKELEQKVEGELRNKEQQMSLFGNFDADFKDQNERLADIEDRLREAESLLDQRKRKLMVAESNLSRYRSNCTTLEVEAKTFQNRQAQIKESIYILEEEHEELLAKSDEYDAAYARRQQECRDAEDSLKEIQESSEQGMMQFRKTQEQIRVVDRDIAGIIAKKGVLEDLQRKMEGFSDGSKAVLQGKLSSVFDEDDYCLLTDLLDVDKQHTSILETFLGSSIDSISLRNPEKITDAINVLEADHLGRACFHMAMDVKSQFTASHPNLTHLIDVVRVKDASAESAIKNLFNGVYVCKSLEVCMSVISDIDFRYIITENGELIDSSGFVHGGPQKAKKDSFLHRQQEIERFTEAQDSMQKQLDALRSDANSIQERLDADEEALGVARNRLNELNRETNTIETQKAGLRESLARNAQQKEKQLLDLERLNVDHDASAQKLEEANNALETAEKEIEGYRNEIYDAEENLKLLREERELCRDSFNKIRLDIAEKKQRLALLEQGVEQIKKRIGEIDIIIDRRGRDIEALRKQVDEFNKDKGIQQERIAEIEKQLLSVRSVLDEDREILMEMDQSIKKDENTINEQRVVYEDANGRLNKLEVQLATKRSEIEFVVEETQREYETTLADVDWKSELWQAGDALPERMKLDMDDDNLDLDAPIEREGQPTEQELEDMERFDWDSARDEVEALRSRINGMGAVNLVAIEEYKDLRERHEFLKNQSDDLWKAKEQLVSAIEDINATSLELFRKTFEQIKENFHYTFDTLFGGGQADLDLIDGEDPLESGIEITARPPGTRLKSLALLSGGQKTMTAVALLFAIYMVKPSPFCVLDEIDAPLDDANIGRFCDMLGQFLKYSQFLIITHSKRTIAAADTIYGVTMQERGVSRLISMRFNKQGSEAELIEA
jgi:chromosome segregation protein